MKKDHEELETQSLASQVIAGVMNAQDQIIESYIKSCGIIRKGKQLFLENTTIPVLPHMTLYETGSLSNLRVYELHIEKITKNPSFQIGILMQVDIKQSKVDVTPLIGEELIKAINSTDTKKLQEQKQKKKFTVTGLEKKDTKPTE